ncbi:hypothetical protein D9Q98_004424 [Chlorella vulgaris]|uniref:mannan endo-1,4-beta-mannosidase n=1 Tax=Chlorella vulgaris TaxID=3077 RepID=A0A9D4TPL4_CHLVU|nr:hypothetical protein D9Q98_004424 [Chlorella vulgaris]
MPVAALAVLLLACWPTRAASAAPSDATCFDCEWLELPLDEWNALRNTTVVEVLPWGEAVTLPPVDYRRLGEELCECVLDSREGIPETRLPASHYVRAEGTRFMLHGEPFRFAGWNAYQALPWAASNDSRFLSDLDSLFSHAAELGLVVGRVFVVANGAPVRPPFLQKFDDLQPELAEAPWITLQPAAGVMNETVLEALDHLMVLAADNGIKLVLTLADYHATFGANPAGIEPYVQWVKGSLNLTGYTVLDFYTDSRIKLIYKHNLCTLANRVNSLTGVKYRDDPALFSWDLINEPRCPACPGPSRGAALTAWVDEMSAFMSCVDGNHMVHVGSEGYFSDSQPQFIASNPGSWSLCSGVDFTALTALPHVHYGAAHMYESMRGSWNEATRSNCGWDCVTDWFRTWLQSHFDASGVVGKPLVLEEYGKPWDEVKRNEMFKLVQDEFRVAWQQNASSPAAGAMFWGATAGPHINWNGFELRLDGGPSVPAPVAQADELKKQMPPEQTQWLADVHAMQAAFRHSVLEELCQAVVKEQFPPTLASYSSNTMLAIVAGMAAEAAASAGEPMVVAAANSGD